MDPRSILVIQLRRIGDVILTTPAVAALKKRFPRAAIDFLAEPAPAQALAGNPHLRKTIVYNARGPLETLSWLRKIRAGRYDWVIDYLGTPRSAMLTASSGAAVRAGPAHVSHRWAYNRRLVQSSTTYYGALEKIRVLFALGVPPEGADFMPRLHLLDGERVVRSNIVALAPASRKETRRWPASSFSALSTLLKRRYGCEILVLWGPGERPLAEEVASGAGEGTSVSPETRDLKDAARIIASCRLLVTNCSGTKHLAVALGVPTVTIHGSSDPTSWNPPDPRHLVVRRDELFCIGCGLNSCPYGLECLKDMSAERVFAAAAKLLDEPARVAS